MDEHLLPASVLAWATPRGNEYAWPLAPVAVAVTAAQECVLANLGGQVQFRVPGLTRELTQAVGFAITRDGKRVYAALGPANRVAEVDAATLKVTRMYLVGKRVWHVALSPDEKRLYAVNGNSSDVSVIDLARHAVVKTIAVGREPWGVAVRP